MTAAARPLNMTEFAREALLRPIAIAAAAAAPVPCFPTAPVSPARTDSLDAYRVHAIHEMRLWVRYAFSAYTLASDTRLSDMLRQAVIGAESEIGRQLTDTEAAVLTRAVMEHWNTRPMPELPAFRPTPNAFEVL